MIPKGTSARCSAPRRASAAAALTAASCADEGDVFSIGTNDLVQYTLAVDRGNAALVTRFTPLHPAVLRLIDGAVRDARAVSRDCSVCGEMASQPLMAYALLGLGVRTLSVSAVAIPVIKRLIRGVSLEAAGGAARAALGAATAREAERLLRQALMNELGAGVTDGLLGLS
ncbi:MAG: putative PEP-binding protein [Gemmatimonadota bacterium]